MVYRPTTLRKMAPVTRSYARLLGELSSVLRKGKNLVPKIASLEHDSRALATAKQGIDYKDIIFVLTREDVIECAKQAGIPAEAITDDVLRQVRKGVDSGLECWSDVMTEAIKLALEETLES